MYVIILKKFVSTYLRSEGSHFIINGATLKSEGEIFVTVFFPYSFIHDTFLLFTFLSSPISNINTSPTSPPPPKPKLTDNNQEIRYSFCRHNTGLSTIQDFEAVIELHAKHWNSSLKELVSATAELSLI